MNVGVIGTGMIANQICPLLSDWGLQVRAVCSTARSVQKGEALAAACATNGEAPAVVTSYDELLAQDNVDVVYVATPNNLHLQHCRQALLAGKNVICEKPLASTFEEAQELASLAKSRGLLLWEEVSTPYLPSYAMVRQWLSQIGQVRVVSLNYSQYSSRYDAFLQGRVLPAFDPAKCGGTLMDLGVYNLHYAMGLFGKPIAAHYQATVQRGIDTSGVSTLDYGDFKAVLVAAKDCGAPANNTIQGQKGFIVQQAPSNALSRVELHLNDGSMQTFEPAQEPRWHGAFASFVQDWNTAQAAHAAATGSQEATSWDDEGHRHCYAMLQKSLDVMEVLTHLRREAGIRFPAD